MQKSNNYQPWSQWARQKLSFPSQTSNADTVEGNLISIAASFMVYLKKRGCNPAFEPTPQVNLLSDEKKPAWSQILVSIGGIYSDPGERRIWSPDNTALIHICKYVRYIYKYGLWYDEAAQVEVLDMGCREKLCLTCSSTHIESVISKVKDNLASGERCQCTQITC